MADEQLQLDYLAPAPAERRRPLTIGRPVSWQLAAGLIAFWSMPFWFGLLMSDIDAYYLRPMLDMAAGVILGAVVLFVLFIRSASLWRREDRPTSSDERRAWARVVLIISTSLLLLFFDSAGFGLLLRFQWRHAEFEDARAAAMASLAPGQSAPHGPIGPFPFVSVERGFNGVAFKLATNSGIECGGETLLVPPGDGGPLGGGWRWEATD